jgi:hypothetical protein
VKNTVYEKQFTWSAETVGSVSELAGATGLELATSWVSTHLLAVPREKPDFFPKTEKVILEPANNFFQSGTLAAVIDQNFVMTIGV